MSLEIVMKVKSEAVLLDPEEARRLRRDCHFPRQRTIYRDNVRRLAIEIEKGRFIAGSQIYICALPDGREWVVNGNHTLEAIADTNTAVPITITRCLVPDEEAANRIYARFDIHRTRGWKDALRGAGMFEFLDGGERAIEAFGSAMGVILQDFRLQPQNVEARTSRDVRLEAMAEYKEWADMFIVSTASGSPKIKRFLRRAVVFAVGIITFRYQPSTADDFWGGIARDDGLQRLDPRKTLLEHLRDTPVAGISLQQQANNVASAWNAFFANRDLKLIKPGPDFQFHLAGTPWVRKSSRKSED